MKQSLLVFLSLSALLLATEEPRVALSEPAIVQEYAQQSSALREQLKKKFEEAEALARTQEGEERYASLLNEVKALKKEKEVLDEKWRKAFVEDAGTDSYGIWDVGEITLSQLIIEYGASDYLYIIPPELSAMKLSLFSGIPLPRESWGEMIEMILSQNGVGVKKLNPCVKQLYILKLDPAAIEGIVSQEVDLTLFDPQARIFFVFSPKAEQVKSVHGFFERFSDPKQTIVQSIASKVVLVSSRETVEKLVGLYHAIWEKERGKVIKLVKLNKIAPAEAEKVLKAVFGDVNARAPRTPFNAPLADELSILTLPQGLVLVGDQSAVDRGERVLTDLELQMEDPGEKIVYWYSCKHSNPEDIASVLEQVYDSLIGAQMEKKEPTSAIATSPSPVPPLNEPNPAQVFPFPSTAYNPVMPVNPTFVQPGVIDTKPKATFGNFVVDSKTASILMVVRREELSKIKNLLKKLDVPKRMVQIDVLLVEKRLTDRKQAGINLLNIGSTASNGPHQDGASFTTEEQGFDKGILKYILKKPQTSSPGFDLTLSFLLAQDDLRINANPSVLAINQTPATISIVEEISINNGAIQLDTTNGVTIEKSYTRAQYGTTIVMVPTIHLPDLEEDPCRPGFVSLQTDVTFDTTEVHHMFNNDRPPVTRRHVVNEVQIADGETVILGGLRRKSEEDKREKIPFLGDLPGIGKLFGATKSTDTNTEMFIFITPHIILDPIEDLRRLRQEEYSKRAGDIPEFLEKLDQAKAKERRRLFDNSIKMLFDPMC